MTESDEPKPRTRWFQFDLRLLFVVIAAIGAILALEVARSSRKAERKLLGTLQVGESVSTAGDANGIMIFVGGRNPRETITEIGDDFVAIRGNSDNSEFFIPLSRISGVRRYLPSAASVAKTPPKSPGSVPTKTKLKTSNAFIGKTGELSPPGIDSQQ